MKLSFIAIFYVSSFFYFLFFTFFLKIYMNLFLREKDF